MTSRIRPRELQISWRVSPDGHIRRFRDPARLRRVFATPGLRCAGKPRGWPSNMSYKLPAHASPANSGSARRTRTWHDCRNHKSACTPQAFAPQFPLLRPERDAMVHLQIPRLHRRQTDSATTAKLGYKILLESLGDDLPARQHFLSNTVWISKPICRTASTLCVGDLERLERYSLFPNIAGRTRRVFIPVQLLQLLGRYLTMR